MTYTYDYPMFSLAVDIVILRRRPSTRSTFDVEDCDLLVIRRAVKDGDKPNAEPGKWALPGGFVNIDESADDAVFRELEEETSLAIGGFAWLSPRTAVDRDPRGRVVSLPALCVLWASDTVGAAAGDDASELSWVALTSKIANDLAFDHTAIVADAVGRLYSGRI